MISIADTDNMRSVAVMQRLGMTFDHHATLPDEETGEPFESVIYAITAEEWHRRVT